MDKYLDLIEDAFKALNNAYAPYSNYKVGACIECSDGKHIFGANIENASYGATNCGERSALFSAYSQGYKKEDLKAIAIVTNGNTVGYPCGICRQVMVELLDLDTDVILSNGKETKITKVKDLLPFAFSKKDLE